MPLSDDDIESMSDEELQDEISYRQALTSGEEPNSGTQKGKPDAFDVAFDELERLNHEVMLRALNAPGASITETPTPRRPKPKKKPSGQASKQKTPPSSAQPEAAPGADVEVAPDPSSIDATFLPEMLWRQKVLQPHPDLHRLIQSPLPLSDAVSRICSAAITECEAIATKNAGTVSLQPLHLWFGFLALGRLEHQDKKFNLPGSLYRAWKFDESTYMRARRQVMEQTRIHKEGKPGTVARHALTTIICNESFALHKHYSPKDRYLAARHLLAALLLHATAEPELKRFLEYLGLSLKAPWAQLEVNIELNKYRDRAGAWVAVLSHSTFGSQVFEPADVLSRLNQDWEPLINRQQGTRWSGTMKSVLRSIRSIQDSIISKVPGATNTSNHISVTDIPYGLTADTLILGLMLYAREPEDDVSTDQVGFIKSLAMVPECGDAELSRLLHQSFIPLRDSSVAENDFRLVPPELDSILQLAADYARPGSPKALSPIEADMGLCATRHLVAALLVYSRQLQNQPPRNNSSPETHRWLGDPKNFERLLEAVTGSLQDFLRTDSEHAWNTLLAQFGLSLEGNGLNSSRVCTDEELGQDVTLTAQALAEVFRSAHSESSGSDFILALYGPWGRGKTTLMEKVVENLTSKSTEPSAIKEKTFARLLKRLRGWCDQFTGRCRREDTGYRALTFSAWKYPTRPEVWVHLYERIREAASSQDWCQRLRLSFRLGLLDAGWTPLISGLVLMFIAACLTDQAAGLSWGIFTGISGALLSSTFFLRTTAFGKMVAQRYLKAPDHTDKLGLQAVIGRDLTHLLQAWITPPTRAPDKPTQEQREEDAKLSWIDFWRGRRGCWCAVGSLLLVFSIITALLCGARSHYSKQLSTYKSPANQDLIQAAKAPLETHLFSASLGSPIVSGTWVKLKEPAPEPESPRSLTIICTVAGLLAIAYLWLVTRPLQQQEKLLLIVDDLDRCEPHQMLAVIDSLRLFLDDRAMSGRMQIAMLMDRELLETALRVRATESKMFEQEKTQWDSYCQSQREKLFVCELEMPALSETNRDEIVDKLLPLPVTDPQPDWDETEAPAAPATAAGAPSAATSGMPAQPAGAFGHPPEKTPAEAPSVKGQPSPPLQHSLGEESPAPPPAQDIRTPATSTPKITAREIKALQEAIKKVPAQLLTPRSIRMIKVRFELARLLLKTFAIPATSTQLAHLIISRFIPQSQASTRADSSVERIVSYVTCDSRSKDKKAS